MSFFKKTAEKLPTSTIDGLREMITSSAMPDRVLQIAHRELDTLSKISPSAAEYAIGLTYLEYLLSLPWNKKTEDNLDIGRAERILDERHYGLDRIKERILDHLAVKILIANKKPRILVVDDEEITRKNLEHILKKEDYVVVTAANGMEALEKMGASDFDVIMTDLKMEKVNGLDLLEKARVRYPDSRVIMITAYATVASAVEAMKKGAFHYITKPFKLDEVRGTVREAVSSRTSTISSRGSVLCFAGPPGTGKTSLGRAVADALGRKFTRISLGGIKDEAEIRGHRRTYAGAMPGRIIEEIRRSQVINPLIMLDEVDKIGQDFRGDSASALLEVLDPEQNRSFIDHYLDVPFDLSNVLFIVTANIPDVIQDPLRDRMEIMEFTGYTEDEKVKIALGYLVPRQINEQGLSDYPPRFTPESLLRIIQEYTREAGIRDLERQIAAVCRKIAAQFVHHKETGNITVTAEGVEKFLGPRKYYFEVADGTGRTGVATGLVRTDVGGDIIFVEAAQMKGNKELILTGSLGTVMRESAQAALSYIRSNASFFHIQDDFFDTRDIHVHVPAGAIPKDGPSAGATIAIALLSLFMGKPARRDVAISGELTLSGNILPVGGVKEKILAARRAGVKTVVFPLRNRADMDNLSEDVKKDLSIHLVDRIEEAVDLVLGSS
ncbi:MAG: endopeptidase La [Nitrospirae bacterium]|nr:endopeptidase La [Nitrospirota bacterium]MCL5420941.1 endopeptidase La [Nitrospirota bacterium]